MKFVVSTIFFLLVAHSHTQSTSGFVYPTEQTVCSTGTCVNIKNCPPLLKILENSTPLNNESAELLKSSQCGFDGRFPKVCCDRGEVNVRLPIGNRTIDDNDNATSPEVSGPPDVTGHPNLRFIDHKICGPLAEDRIFGGEKTGIVDFPWMALVAYQINNNRHEFRCGGTVISKRYVLTAAHCVVDLPTGLVLTGARLGDHDISKERDCEMDEKGLEVFCTEKYQDFLVDVAHPHPEFSRKAFHNDIALIRLDRDADFRPISVKPICLPIGLPADIGQGKVTVTGWGATETGPRSFDLLKVSLRLVPNDQCAEIYRNDTQIWRKQICAGGSNKMDSCNGDSGGPLQDTAMYNGINTRYVQHGIVSFGWKQCGVDKRPGVYTRVSYYLKWILDTMRH